MAEWYAGRADEYGDEIRKVVQVGDREVVVLKVDERFYAVSNTCLHMGGPVGEGVVMGKVCAVLDEGKRVVRQEFDEHAKQLICPWHGWAYNLATGVFAGDETLKLPTFEVEVREGDVYVVG